MRMYRRLCTTESTVLVIVASLMIKSAAWTAIIEIETTNEKVLREVFNNHVLREYFRQSLSDV